MFQKRIRTFPPKTKFTIQLRYKILQPSHSRNSLFSSRIEDGQNVIRGPHRDQVVEQREIYSMELRGPIMALVIALTMATRVTEPNMKN